MSIANVRIALEARLAALAPELETAFENAESDPNLDTPYQAVTLLFGQPDNTVFGPAFQERGIFQVTLCYPLGRGTKDVMARAQLIRDQFPRGLSLPNGGIVTTIELTPEIGVGLELETEYQLPVKIRWYANVA